MTRHIYLAGPMRGISEFNFPAFLAAAEVLKSHGFEVWNPAQRDIDDGFEWEGKTGNEAVPLGGMLAEDLVAVADEVDGVVLLPGWEKSKGVRAELATAAAVGTPVAQMTTPWAGLRWESAERFLEKWGHVNTGEPVKTCPSSAADADNHVARAVGAPLDFGVDSLPVGTVPEAGLPKGEVRITSSTGGQKGSKLARFDLIPTRPLTLLAEHYGRGAAKYADRNWEKGTDWHLNYAALMRHATQFWAGEDLDEETGSPHMAAVAWHAFALLEFMTTHPELDDRPKGE